MDYLDGGLSALKAIFQPLSMLYIVPAAIGASLYSRHARLEIFGSIPFGWSLALKMSIAIDVDFQE